MDTRAIFGHRILYGDSVMTPTAPSIRSISFWLISNIDLITHMVQMILQAPF